MNNRLLRTFVSVTVPNALLATRDMLKTTIQHKKDNLKWVKDGQVHLTLKFIGHTPPDGVDDIHHVLHDISTAFSPMEFEIAGTGCFPVPTRPRVLWTGISGDTEPLTNLVTTINEKLDPLGYPKEKNTFIPHITLARIKYPPKLTPDISGFLQTSFHPIPFHIKRFSLMSSELTPSGAIYRQLHEYTLNE